MQPNFFIENQYKNLCVAGFDEAGRGPLAGPVVAACVIANQGDFPLGVDDSKKLTKARRKQIFLQLQKNSLFGVGIVDAGVVDEINILQATKKAMFCALENLRAKYQIEVNVALIDGNFQPFAKTQKMTEIIPIIKGDQKSLSIAAASIIAKETRDKIMEQIHLTYPQYGFDRHSGYGTEFHRQKIKEFGICEFHRKSFEPIKSMLNASN